MKTKEEQKEYYKTDKWKKYRKKYYQEHKEQIKEYSKKWNKRNLNYFKKWYEEHPNYNKKWREENKDNPKFKEKNNARQKKWYEKPSSKIKVHRRKKNRRKTDSNYRIRGNIRSHFMIIMKSYSETGKIMPIKKYGIDIEGIIKHLGPIPNDGRNYEADHIIPASMFDHNDLEQIKKAWAPTNFQWLTREINNWKGGRLIKPLTDKEKEKLQLKLEKK